MTLRKKIYIIAPAILMCIAGLLWWCFSYSSDRPSDYTTATSFPTVTVPLEMPYYTDALRAYPLQKIAANSQHTPHIVAGVVPHHALASRLIAEFFQKLASAQSVKKFVIISPNHPDAGVHHVTNGIIDWKTPDGIVHTDAAEVEGLADGRLVGQDAHILADEHGMYTLLPFIKHYFPDASIVPLIVSSKTLTEESRVLAGKLASYMDDDTVVLASVDFSHYLASDIALQKDVLMQKLLETRNYDAMIHLQSDYLDSPQSIIMTFLIADAKNATALNILRHTTSAEFLHRPLDSSTSYFTIFLSKKSGS